MKRRILGMLSFCVMPICFANSIDNSSAITHPVGSCYGGGVVFYLNKNPNPPAGQHGLIAALNDASPSDTGLIWDPSSPPVGSGTPVATQFSDFTGLANMTRILNTPNDIPNPGDRTWPSAEAAKKFITSETCPTCTAWYFPSRDELATLYFQSTNVSGFWSNPSCKGHIPDGVYWSSTQEGPAMAWAVNFNSGIVVNYPSSMPFNVRAIRAF